MPTITKLPGTLLDDLTNFTFANANVTGNLSTGNANLGNLATANFVTVTSNAAIGNLKTDNILYSNGNPWVFPTTPAGANTEIQFNNAGSLGASANLVFNTSTKTLTVDKISANGAGLSSLSGANVIGAVANATYATDAGTAQTALSVSGANVSGQVGNAAVAGTVYTNSQPNITSVGNLTSLTVTGNTAFSGAVVDLGSVSNLKISGGSNNQVLKTDGSGNLSWVTQSGGSGSPGGGNTQIQFNDDSAFAGSANLTFNKATNTLSVTNITANGAGITFITGANVSGFVPNANVANTAYSVSGANVSGDVAGANHANVADLANSVAGANVTGFVPNANVANTAYSVAGSNVSGQVANASVAGTVYTNSQPNITSVGTLTSLSVSGNITSGNANLGNLVTANFFTGNGSLLTSITGANVSGQVGNALIAGTVYTNAQPNITSVGTLSSLSVTGNVTAGNITSNASLTAVDVIITGNLAVQGNTTYINVTELALEDPLIQLGTNPNNAPLTSNDGKDRGLQLHYYSGSDKHAFMGWDNSNAEFAFGSDVSTTNDVVTFTEFGNVRANLFIGNGSQLTGITAATAVSLINGTSNVVIDANSNVRISANGVANIVRINGGVANVLTVAGNVDLGNNYIRGNGALLTGVDALTALGADVANTIANGTSNINTPVLNGNITVGIGGVPNTVVFTSTGMTVSGAVTTANLSVQNYSYVTSNLGNVSGTTTINLINSNFFRATSTGTTAWVFSNPASTGNACGFTLELTNGGSYTQTWPLSVRWPNATAPELTPTGVDVLVFITSDGGTTWRGAASMLNST